MKTKFIILIPILFFTNTIYSQTTCSSTDNLKKDTLFIKRKSDASLGFWNNNAVKISFVPILLSGASAATWNSRKDIRDIRNRYIPTFNNRYDDYLQYIPAATVFGLKAMGVKGRNDLKRSTLTYATSLAIMGILVNGIKYTAKVPRPDGSSKNSFPSGHTAMAFTNASFLDKEYAIVNPAYSIGGYTLATMTAVGRGLNNRHWVSDVFAGAGIGIFSSQIAYFFIDKLYGNKGDNLSVLSQFEGNENPSFLALKIGYAGAFESIIEDDNKSLARAGWEAGLEGAYFFTKNWGLGGQFTTASFPFYESKVSIPSNLGNKDADIVTEALGNLNLSLGPYYALHFSDKCNLMLKGLLGYSFTANGQVNLKIKNQEEDITTLASYEPDNTVQITAGLAFTYNLKSNLGVTLYTDFNHSYVKYKYIRNKDFLDPGEPEILIKETPFNYKTIGIRLTGYF